MKTLIEAKGQIVSRFYMHNREDLSWKIKFMPSGWMPFAWIAYEIRKNTAINSYPEFYCCYDISKKELRKEKLKKLNCDI